MIISDFIDFFYCDRQPGNDKYFPHIHFPSRAFLVSLAIFSVFVICSVPLLFLVFVRSGFVSRSTSKMCLASGVFSSAFVPFSNRIYIRTFFITDFLFLLQHSTTE